MEELIDDGGLECLGIPNDESNRSFNCSETTQQNKIKLIFLKLWHLHQNKKLLYYK